MAQRRKKTSITSPIPTSTQSQFLSQDQSDPDTTMTYTSPTAFPTAPHSALIFQMTSTSSSDNNSKSSVPIMTIVAISAISICVLQFFVLLFLCFRYRKKVRSQPVVYNQKGPLETEFNIPKAHQKLYDSQTNPHHSSIVSPPQSYSYNQNLNYSKQIQMLQKLSSSSSEHETVPQRSSLYSETPENSKMYETLDLENKGDYRDQDSVPKYPDSLNESLDENINNYSNNQPFDENLNEYQGLSSNNRDTSIFDNRLTMTMDSISFPLNSNDQITPIMSALNNDMNTRSYLTETSDASSSRDLRDITDVYFHSPETIKNENPLIENTNQDEINSIDQQYENEQHHENFNQEQINQSNDENVDSVQQNSLCSNDLKPSIPLEIESPRSSSNVMILAELISQKLNHSGIPVLNRYIAQRPNELTLVTGDIVSIIETFETGMIFGINHSSRMMGMFPLACLLDPNEVKDKDDSEKIVIN